MTDRAMTHSMAAPERGLSHTWVAAGIVASAARFIPLPFVDDMVRGRCRRYVVARTLAYHGREDLLNRLRPYYESGGGCLSGCLASAVRIPLKLLLFPVRKIIAILTSVRGVPLEIMRLVLLGRTLDRELRRVDSLEDAAVNAERMRVAFDEAFARMDFRILRAAMADALSTAGGWKASAMATAKKLAGRVDLSDQTLEAEPGVDLGATTVEAVLERPETLALFAEFDERFDRAMVGDHEADAPSTTRT